MIPNSDITIYNKYVDNGAEKYQRAVIRDVVWQSIKAISRIQLQTAANSALILIPFERGDDYQKPKAWLNDRNGWTLQEGDIVVRGIATQEITTLYLIKNLRADYDDVFTIASIDAMDQGSANVQHWEVNCK